MPKLVYRHEGPAEVRLPGDREKIEFTKDQPQEIPDDLYQEIVTPITDENGQILRDVHAEWEEKGFELIED